MDEARAVLARLERIDALEQDQAPAAVLLEEVRALLREAEAWVRTEAGAVGEAVGALERCQEAVNAPESPANAIGGLW